MPELPSVLDLMDKDEALERRLGFRQFISQYPQKQYTKGQTILLQNETPPGVFVIESGKVRSYTITPEGHEQLISIHSRGEDIPVGCAFGVIKKPRYFYDAYTRCVVRIIPQKEFVERLLSDMELLQQTYLNNVEQLASALSRIHAMGQPRASNKVALTLIYLADRLGSRPWAKPKFTEISITQEEIANLLGMTRETVSFELKKLRIKKMVSYSRKNYVLYIERLREHFKKH
jgi:CRP/FNR family transcriptional regulator